MIARAAIAAALAAAIAAPGASACSVVSGYRVPTTLDLAAKADTIVLATVTGERRGSSGYDTTSLARPVGVLKGRLPSGPIEMPGSTVAADPRVRVTRSAPRELREPNPDALMGSCVRYAFRKGMTLVLFLERGPGGRLVPYRAPFSRDAEDVAGPGALWVKAVRDYAAVSVAPPARWDDLLRRRIAVLRTRPGDPDAAAIAQDMAIELAERAKRRGGDGFLPLS